MKKVGVRKYVLFLSILLLVFLVNGFPISNHPSHPTLEDSSSQMVMEEGDLSFYNIYKLREMYQNQDIIGKISIENVNQFILIVRGRDNQFYQNHTITGRPNLLGTTFLDYRNHLTDQKLIIYNYHGENNVLNNYLEESYYPNHSKIKWETIGEADWYQIFAIIRGNSDQQKVRTDVSDEDWQKYLEKVKLDSVYDTGVDVTESDDILVLQSNHQEDYYIQIFARKMKKG